VAFAVVRPPGHHARRERAAGFCLLNNVAVAAMALRAGGLAQRIAILDWDVHHGDGTQAIFDADPDLCYASTHQMPLYPGTGDAADRGAGAGLGSKHNAPLPPGSGDAAFTEAWMTRLLPAVEAFAPEAILVSAGYDAHRLDPLAELEVTEAAYRDVAAAIGRIARDGDLRGVALTLEGGYDLDALRASAAATVAGLLAGLAGSEAV
jgi:acetoin utilization deacetylase AcuC-like enzyme